MTTVSSTDSSNPYADLGLAVRQTTESSDTMGQDTFLKLLTAQLQNQDPLKPLDNSAFLGQLAQISTVEGINSLQDSVDALASSLGSAQNLQAAQLVGHGALVASDFASLGAEGGISGAAQLSGAGDVVVDIRDGSGQLIRTLDLGTRPSGLAHFSWDGVDASGTRAPAGSYTLQARLVEADSQTALPTYTVATVRGVSFDGGVTLDLEGLAPVALRDVTQIM